MQVIVHISYIFLGFFLSFAFTSFAQIISNDTPDKTEVFSYPYTCERFLEVTKYNDRTEYLSWGDEIESSFYVIMDPIKDLDFYKSSTTIDEISTTTP
jgi:hypothetical protein